MSLKYSSKLQGALNKKYIIKVVCGAKYLTFLTHAGMVFNFGDNKYGQLGQGNTDSSEDPAMITSLLNYRILDIASGHSHIIALGAIRDLTKSKDEKNLNNMILVWGDNSYGQLGNSSEDMLTSPTIMDEFNDVKISSIDAGFYHSVIVLDGKAFGFGLNKNGQVSQILNDDIIRTPQKIALNDFSIVELKCSPHSTLYLTADNKLVLLGQITNNSLKIYQMNERDGLQFIFNDSCLTIISNETNFTIKDITNNDLQEVKNPDEELKQDENLYDNIFRDFDLSKELITEQYDHDLFHDSGNFEQSIEELRSYINLVGISFSTDSTVSTGLSFRPKNLPKKTPQEEEYHRRLVEENRKMYIKMLREKHEHERKTRIRIEQRKERMKKLQTKWEVDILPAWFKYRNDIKSIRPLFQFGLPSPIRGKVWLLCIGNNFSITPEYYEIELKKGM
jgi:hypothetical protein